MIKPEIEAPKQAQKMFVWFCWTMLKRYFPQEQFSDSDSPQSQFTGSRLLLRFGNHHLCLTAGVLWTWLMCARRTPPSLPEQAYTPSQSTPPPPPPSPASRQPDICPPTSYLYLRHPHHDFGQCLIRTNVRPSMAPGSLVE